MLSFESNLVPRRFIRTAPRVAHIKIAIIAVVYRNSPYSINLSSSLFFASFINSPLREA